MALSVDDNHSVYAYSLVGLLPVSLLVQLTSLSAPYWWRKHSGYGGLWRICQGNQRIVCTSIFEDSNFGFLLVGELTLTIATTLMAASEFVLLFYLCVPGFERDVRCKVLLCILSFLSALLVCTGVVSFSIWSSTKADLQLWWAYALAVAACILTSAVCGLAMFDLRKLYSVIYHISRNSPVDL